MNARASERHAFLRFDAVDVMLAVFALANLVVAAVVLIVAHDNASIAYFLISLLACLLWLRIWVMCRVVEGGDRTP